MIDSVRRRSRRDTLVSPVARIAARVAIVIALAASLGAQTPPDPTPGVQNATSLGNVSSPALRDAVANATRSEPPATLEIANREIIVFRATLLLRTPAVRAEGAQRHITSLDLQSPQQVRVRPLAGAVVVSIGDRDVFAIVPADLDPAEETTVTAEGDRVAARLQQAIGEVGEARAPWVLAGQTALALLATILLIVLLRFLVRAHRGLVTRTTEVAERQLARLPVDEVTYKRRLLKGLQTLISVVFTTAGLILAYSWLTFVLRRFPYTRPWGEALRHFLIHEVFALGRGMVQAVPDLFAVLLIVIVTRVISRVVDLLFVAVEEGRTTLPWIYPETVQPTRRLVTFFLWIFALALAFPRLPGSDTDAFRGVSVFVGLVISLGSSGIVNQVMSGFTLTYSRALRLNDVVRIGEVEGVVTHMGSLSTKLKTPKGEEVTIPNAVVVAAQTTNYSRYADTDGVYLGTSVTIGYDTPWRQVKALLLLAATRTPGVRQSPPPVVRQSALQDFYVQYTLLICPEQMATRLVTLDRLHGNILDAFNEHGVQIMSPNYEADPSGPKVVPRDQWFAAPATPTE